MKTETLRTSCKFLCLAITLAAGVWVITSVAKAQGRNARIFVSQAGNPGVDSHRSSSRGEVIFRSTTIKNRAHWYGVLAKLAIALPSFWSISFWNKATYAAIFIFVVLSLRRYQMYQVAKQYNARMEERLSERLRIARELHDTLLQSIHGLMLRVHYLSEALSENDPARPMLKVALERAEALVVEGRNRIQLLRGETDEALTLPELLTRITNDSCSSILPIIHVTEEGNRRLLRPVVREELYRICRESIVNSINHAEASRIDVGITYGGRFLEVRCLDNGKGMPDDAGRYVSRKGHWGLQGMNERAKSLGAQFKLWSCNGKGTEVQILLRAETAYTTKNLRDRSGQRTIQKMRHVLQPLTFGWRVRSH